MINSGEHSETTDAFGMGITLLMALTGLPALKILPCCRLMLRAPDAPNEWVAPGVTDTTAGAWPPAVVTEVLRIVAGLSKGEDPEDRLPLPEALRRLEALVDAAPPEPPPSAAMGQAATSTQPAAGVVSSAAEVAEQPRLCIICESEPREVRFRCGHAVCCHGCVPRVQRCDNLCPQCREPLGDNPIADAGPHVQLAATFHLACQLSGGGSAAPAAVSLAASAAAPDAAPAVALAAASLAGVPVASSAARPATVDTPHVRPHVTYQAGRGGRGRIPVRSASGFGRGGRGQQP